MTRPKNRSGGKLDVSGMTRHHFPAAPFPHGIQLIFKKYDYSQLVTPDANGIIPKTQFSNAQETGQYVVELPMPKSLTDATGISINSMEKTFTESFIVDTLAPIFTSEGGGLGGVAGNLFSMGESGVKGVADFLTKESENANSSNAELAAQGSRVLSFLMSNTLNSFSPGLGKAMGASRGTAINPQATLSFEGVNLRNFTLDWTLYPESKEEAESIRKIVRGLKSQVLPSVQSVTGDLQTSADGVAGNNGVFTAALSRAFLTYPAVVSINLLGIQENHFVKFKPCMCSGINVDYGASGEIVIAEGGVPQGVKLSMEFKELEIQTAEDYSDAVGAS